MLCFAVGGDPSIDERRRLVGMVANGLTRGVQSRRFTLNTLHGLGWGCEDRISVEYEYICKARRLVGVAAVASKLALGSPTGQRQARLKRQPRSSGDSIRGLGRCNNMWL